MRCAQPFIPIASGRLGKQILELRGFGLADFSKHIADKYSGAELGKFKFPTLTLLPRVSRSWNVFNITHIFKNQVISVPLSTTQLNLNLNILLFLNTVVQRFVGGESKPQDLHSTRFTFSNNSTVSITKTSLSRLYQQVHTRLMQFFASRESKSQISQSGEWTFSQSNTILITQTSLPQLNQLENIEVRQKEQSNQAVLSFQKKSDAIAVKLPSSFDLQQSESNTPPTQNLQLEIPASQFQIFISRSQSSTLLTEKKKPVLIHLLNMNQITSTVERTSQLIQRLQNTETQTILQYRKLATHSIVFYNTLSPRITREKIPISSISQIANITYQTQQSTNVFNNISRQQIASRESKSQISQSGEWTFSQSNTILITQTSLPQLNQLENIEVRQKEQSNQAVLSFQKKSDAIAVKLPSSFDLQQSESNTPPTQNLQLEIPASQFQIFISRSQSPTLLTEKKKPVLIHLLNMNQITSTVEGTSQLIQRLQNTETQTILQYRKLATHSIVFYNTLSPRITRGKIPASSISQIANITYQTQQSTNVFNNISRQQIVSRESKSQISQSGGGTFSQSNTILITQTSLPQLNQLENIEVSQKEQSNQAVLSFQKKSDAIAVESPSSFGLQQPESNTSPTQNLQLEIPASQAQIFVSRSQSSTLLTENKKPVLIHLSNMNQITSTVEKTSQLIQRLQSIETQTISQYRKLATNYTNSQEELSLAPHHTRTRSLSTHLQSSEDLVLHQQVDRTTIKNQPKQNYPNTLTMEFVQPKANISTVQNDRENKVKGKNDIVKQVQTDIPTINVNRIAEQVYQLIEKKLKIERQRRGML
ncbi:hypothetical protein WA1_40890 [Scytonema hofmannii PCC 7110]|uniref:Uncharacterized protein n=1 Tax=Scytonema hofmannii PCC 7110 TaxID=128403 RepID=A0A139WUK5_9CYAN|nr:hypothetical protein [Scytonema hofmannii]KYC36099.1 hypothetical protein WA1_40890 [Scytonema hofmannii PCC 7110]